MSEEKIDPDPAHIAMHDYEPEFRKGGFLPIETNWFDRVFISVVIWIAMSLLWFRFVEPHGLTIWISNAIALALGIYIVRKG